MNKKIIIGILFNSALVLGTIGCLIFQMIKLNQNIKMISIGDAITKQAMIVNQRNFSTQLELWEYVNDPNAERLELFREHEQAMNDKLDYLEKLIYGGNAVIYRFGLNDLDAILSKWEKIKKNWQILLAAVEEYEKTAAASEITTANSGQDTIEDPVVYEKLMAMREETFKNEKAFDDLDLNGEIDNFMTAQDKYIQSIASSADKNLNLCQKITLILAMFYLVLLIFIALWLNDVLKTIEKKKRISQK